MLGIGNRKGMRKKEIRACHLRVLRGIKHIPHNVGIAGAKRSIRETRGRYN